MYVLWKGVVIAFLGWSLAACSGDGPPPDSGVEGRVWVGPMCPVAQPGVACPDRPLEAELDVFDSDGRIAARARSTADGAYRIPLEAGSYVLTPLPGNGGLPFASPLSIEVADGAWLSLDIYYDSGIR
ncbi:MAG TPA: hypothetical protein VI701_00810 [Anaerolineales bacterium]|nr:hypothetical protein [Anaerolineales bacterium]